MALTQVGNVEQRCSETHRLRRFQPSVRFRPLCTAPPPLLGWATTSRDCACPPPPRSCIAFRRAATSPTPSVVCNSNPTRATPSGYRVYVMSTSSSPLARPRNARIAYKGPPHLVSSIVKITDNIMIEQVSAMSCPKSQMLGGLTMHALPADGKRRRMYISESQKTYQG